MSRSQKTQGLFSDNGIDQMAGSASVNKTSEGIGAWKQVPIEGRLQRWERGGGLLLAAPANDSKFMTTAGT